MKNPVRPDAVNQVAVNQVAVKVGPVNRSTVKGASRPRSSASTAGMALVTTLVLMLLLVVVTTGTLLLSTGNRRQGSDSEQAVRARMTAENGQIRMFALLANDSRATLTPILKPYVDRFMASGKNPTTAPILEPGDKPAILAALGAAYPALTGSTQDGSYTTTIRFQDVRADTATFGGGGQTYYVDYHVVSQGRGVAGRDARRMTSNDGVLKINFSRKFLSEWVKLYDQSNASRYTNLKYNFAATGENYDGPYHSNGLLAFGGTPVFTEGVTTSIDEALFNAGPKCEGGVQGGWMLKGGQSGYDGCTKPDTHGYGIRYGVPKVEFPLNNVNQYAVALNLPASLFTASSSSTTTSDVYAANQALIFSTLNKYKPAGADPWGWYTSNAYVQSGPYLANDGKGNLTGGLFFAANNATSVTLSADGNKQVIETSEYGRAPITKIVIDPDANTTTVSTQYEYWSASNTYNGVPNGQIVANKALILRGPARTGALAQPSPARPDPKVIPPAIAPSMQLNIMAPAMTIRGDITYADDPAKNPDARNVLGLMTYASQQGVLLDAMNNTNQDLYLDAAIYNGGSESKLGLENIAGTPFRGIFHSYGSEASRDMGFTFTTDASGNPNGGYLEDIHYDRRFVNGKLMPPNFPGTSTLALGTTLPIQRGFDED